MKTLTAYEIGKKWGSCSEALEARKQYDSQTEWYKGCNRGDWLFWQLRKVSNPEEIKEKIDQILEKIVTRAIKRALEVYKESKYVAWAEKWLSGEDRSERAAWAAERAASAAWAAERAASAAWAAESAASAESAESAASAARAAWAASAARAARAAAWAAELELQAQDIHEVIPDWPG